MGRLKNHRHEAFCQLLVWGNPRHDPDDEASPPETLHNPRLSYIHAGYRARGESARVGAYELLRREDVRRRLDELLSELENFAKLRCFRWVQMVPDAQQLLLRAVRGEEVTSSQVQSAKVIIDRAEGPLGHRFRAVSSGQGEAAIPIFVLGVDDGVESPE